MNEICQTCALKEYCKHIHVKFCPYSLKEGDYLYDVGSSR